MSETAATFADLNLPADILAAITEMGYETPTAIQEQAIPILLAGRDVVGVAQTGTGKTAAFALPMLALTEAESKHVQALVLAPTRELAVQGAEAISNFSAQTSGLNVVAVYGGSSYGPQLKALREGAQVVVGTPGRVMDLIDRGALDLSNISYFVLDEADEMLRMGFAEDVEKIASGLPEQRVSALFSATMPAPIRRVAEQHMSDPVEVTITPQASTVKTITQNFAIVPMRHKIGALSRVLATSEADAAIVFVRTRATAEELSLELSARGVQAAALSGDVAQQDRERLVERLRAGLLDVLVATDVAARGLDVDRIGLVVNFDVPREVDTYVHRIGRTGRAGREGVALTFVTPKERSRLRRIEQVTKAELHEVELPTPAEVSAYRARKLIRDGVERFQLGRLRVYEDVLQEFESAAAESDLNIQRNDLLLALMALAVRDNGPSKNDEPEILTTKFEETRGERRERLEKESRQSRCEDTRKKERGGKRGPTFAGKGQVYRVEVGHRDGVSPGSIVGAITGEGGLRGSQLGKIDIFPSFSLVEFEHELDDHTMRKVSRAHVSGRALNISKDRGPRGGAPRNNERDGSLYGDSSQNSSRNGSRGKFQGRENRDERFSRRRDGFAAGRAGNREDRFGNSGSREDFGSDRPYSDSQTRKYRADKKFGEERRKQRESRGASRNSRFGAKKRRFN